MRIKLALVLSVLIVILVFAYYSASPAPREPSPSINETNEPMGNEETSESQSTGKVQQTNTPLPQSVNSPTSVPSKKTFNSSTNPSRDVSVLSGRARDKFIQNLPDLSYFAINKSDRFIVDFEDVIAAHPYPGQRSPAPHNDAQIYFSNSDERWQNERRPSDYPAIYAVADGIITGVDAYSLNDHTDYDPPWWHAKYAFVIAIANEGDVVINFQYMMEPYINLENKPSGFYDQFILVESGQVVKKGDVLGYMYVPPFEQKIGPRASTHIAFALERQGQGNLYMYAPAIFTEDVVAEFGNLWQNPKEGWGSSSFGNDWLRARGVPMGMGWMISANENPFGDWPLDVIAYDGIRDLELDGQAKLNATDIGFFEKDLIFHLDGNGDYVSEEFNIPVEWQIIVASIGGPMSVSATSDQRTMPIYDRGPDGGYWQSISPTIPPGRTFITVSDPSEWGWAIAIAPAGSQYVIPGENTRNPSCPPGCPPLPSPR